MMENNHGEPPAAALSPTSDEVYCDVCQKPVAEIRCAQCGPTDVMLSMVLEGLMERWRTAAEGCRSLSRCESVEYYKAAYNAAAVNRDECARELGVVLVDAKSVQKSAALSPREEPSKHPDIKRVQQHLSAVEGSPNWADLAEILDWYKRDVALLLAERKGLQERIIFTADYESLKLRASAPLSPAAQEKSK